MSLPQFPIKPIEVSQYIDGEWTKNLKNTKTIFSPYNQQAIGQFADCSPVDLNNAVKCGREASVNWARYPLKERCSILLQWRQILLRDLSSIAHLAAAESGKTPEEARAELLKGIEVLEFASSLQNLDIGGSMEVSRGVICSYRREPLGLVAGITPFNFPAMVPMWMIPIAIAAGNAFLWKPSDKTPLTSKWLATSLSEAGLPSGVFTVVQGGKEIVEAIIDHSEIKAIAFVGSSPVAKSVYQRGTQLGKRVLALGGAKNQIILLPDAHPEMTAQNITDSFTGCAGQRCMAASLLLAVGDCQHHIEKIIECAQQKVLGENMGAIISKESLERLNQSLTKVPLDGGRILLDGRKHSPPLGFEQGNWIGPCIVEVFDPSASCAQDELFGPLLTILQVKNLGEALTLEAKNPYGNATSIFTQAGALAERVCREAKSAMIGVNIGVPVPREPFSFGGISESKYGHGDITGTSGLDFWTYKKKITTKWQTQQDQNWMS